MRRRERGTLLLEAVAAVALSALVTGGALVTVHMQARAARTLFEEKVAVQLAAGELGRLEARGFDAPDGESPLAEASTALAQLHEGRCTLHIVRDPTDASLRRARVVVRWRPGAFVRHAEADTWFRRSP